MTKTVSDRPEVVVIGGGTGSFTLLQALKTRPINVTALVNMADDGGSTGVLRDELGVLPPGDIRQCLVALSDAPEELRELFNFRFASGTFEGHSFGNIFLSAVETMTRDFNEAVRIASDVLRIRGRVLPLTVDNCQLVMQLNGRTITGEERIGQTTLPAKTRPELALKPTAQITEAARQAVEQAVLVVIAPGDLYTSLAPALLVQGLTEALQTTKAHIAYVCNLVNKPAHTAEFAVHDYAAEIERFLNTAVLDTVLYNTDEPSPALLNRYAVEGEYPVAINKTELSRAHYHSLPGRFLSHEASPRQEHDRLSAVQRSLIRHDSEAVAATLIKLLPHVS